MYSHGHFYGEETKITSTILPGPVSSLREEINQVHWRVDWLLLRGRGPVVNFSEESKS